MYGAGEVFQFNSTRSSYADVDKMNDAAAKAFGADMMKTMLDFETVSRALELNFAAAART